MFDNVQWLSGLQDQLTAYLSSLQVPSQTGRFLPATTGLTAQGKQVALGFSCFAAKLYFMLGLWDTMPLQEQRDWINFLQSFQIQGIWRKEKASANAFIDPAVISYLAVQEKTPSFKQRLKSWLTQSMASQTYLQATIRAETKQAIATLVQLGTTSCLPYAGFAASSYEVKNFLMTLDWKQPWAAGSHAASLAVFLKTQAPLFLPPNTIASSVDTLNRVLESIFDPATGTFFRGKVPEHGILINGAMKVLTALDWIERPIPNPERLIDTCLLHPPQPEGCHLVDAVYVLYRCSQQTSYRRKDVLAFCDQVLNMIYPHFVLSEGGFSYYVGASQTTYYGVPITDGNSVADIHGTVLLMWALAMIFELGEYLQLQWKVIRP